MKIAFLFLLLALCGQSRALDCPAYIINRSGDTASGFIQIKTIYEQMFGKKEVVLFPAIETQINSQMEPGKRKSSMKKTLKVLVSAITMSGITLYSWT